MVNHMNLNVEYIKNELKNNADLVIRELDIKKKSPVYILYFESLTSSSDVFNFVIKPIKDHLNSNKTIKKIRPLIGGPKLKTIEDIEESFYFLENGFVLVIYESEQYAFEAKAELDRGVTMSQTEPNMYGPKDSFCENYQKNLGLIKRRIKNKNLVVEESNRGEYTKNKIGIIYIDDKVNKNALLKIKQKLNQNIKREVTDSYDLVQEIMTSKVFPTIFKTEKPAIVSKFLLKGYIAITIDNTPFVLIIDTKFKDFVNPFTTDKFVTVLRYICLFLTVLTPAVYIALVNFNQETIPTSLLLSISDQRTGVPFPAIVEAVLMLFICEILRESDIRFPSTYGSSASILGALVLGEAAVSAGIVSPIMIIVVAISFVSGLIFTEVKLVSAIRIMRAICLVMAGVLGIYGLSITTITMIAILANVKMNEGTYL